MKKIRLVFIFILLSIFYSCNTTPETAPAESLEDIPQEQTISETEPIAEEIPNEDNFAPIDEESIVVPEEEPESDNQNDVELAEPEIDFPQEITMEYPDSAENSSLTDFPLDEPEYIPEEMDVPASDNEVSVPAEGESANSTESVEPQPPAFLRPAEPIVDDTIVRESIPVPVNPIPEIPAQIVPDIAKDEIVFSRTVRATVGQIIEIPFRGTGWVYLGELASRRGISYDSRRLDPEGQSFIFLAEQPGTYILKFYKEDYVRDYILNDHVQVIIEEAPEPTGTGWFNPPSDWSRVIAEPRWPLTTNVPAESSESNSSQNTPINSDVEAMPLSETVNLLSDEENNSGSSPIPADSSTNTVSENETLPNTSSPIMPENALPEEYMKKAQEEFNAGRVNQAISILEQMRQHYPSGSDELFWLLGQFYEANSPNKDIRTSLDYYQRLIDEYPQSKYYSSAKARKAYLERYYLNIR